MNNNQTDMGTVSIRYEAFIELNEFKMLFNAALFNEWAISGMCDVHKSYKLHDGKECFDGGWFIVCAMLPTGPICNYYLNKHWDLFNIPEKPTALWEFDWDTSKDVIDRLNKFLKQAF